MTMIEVCAGSLKDCIVAQKIGANRIELNSALYLGGLTPSLATLILAKKQVKLPIICMVRPRGAGFCYDDDERAVIFADAELLLANGADGLAFGFLNEDKSINLEDTSRMIALCRQYQAESVFHRAIDCVENIEISIQQLIELGCTRILTSGQGATVQEGLAMLTQLQAKFGQQIEIVMGSGITANNAIELIAQTGIQQIHGTFKKWATDSTSQNKRVNYRYNTSGDYEMLDEQQLSLVVAAIENN